MKAKNDPKPQTRNDSSNPLIPSEETIDSLVVLLQKDYTTDAFSFLENHHRIIHYWGDGATNLLPPAYEETKRRRFSFFDLVWLGIVKELRDFGVEKERIAVLKEELLNPPPHSDLLKHYKSNKKEVEALMARGYGVTTEEIKVVLEELMARQEEVLRLSYSLLALYIFNVISYGNDIRILVGKTGNHIPTYESAKGDPTVNKEYNALYSKTHISVSLRDVMSFFLSMPYVKDEVRQRVLSEKEWKLIELIRENKPTEVKVFLSDGEEIKLVEVTRRKKVSLEARLTEIIVKGGYERIELNTQGGTAQYIVSTQKFTFK